MLLAALSAAVALAALPAPGVRAEFVEHERKNGYAQSWYRYDVRFTNDDHESRFLSLCPNDAVMYANEEGMRAQSRDRLKGFALAVDREAWRFSCIEKALGQGESLLVSMYFRHWDKRELKPMRFATSLGTFEVVKGTVLRAGNPSSGQS